MKCRLLLWFLSLILMGCVGQEHTSPSEHEAITSAKNEKKEWDTFIAPLSNKTLSSDQRLLNKMENQHGK